MARIRIIYDKDGNKKAEYLNGKLIFSSQHEEEKREAGYAILGDIRPYQSMVDGTYIEGRKQHREHLKRNGLIEIGNETKHLKAFGDYKPPPGLKEELVKNYQIAKEQQRRSKR